MKPQIIKTTLVLILCLAATLASAQTKSLKKDFQSLGDNEQVIERVQKLDNQQRIRVVQNRLMDRNNRLEAAVSFGMLSGADSYIESKNFGGMLNYHITPRWSVGVSYIKDSNKLTAEGSRLYDDAFACRQDDPNCDKRFPSIDFPLETKMASVSFYPIYGKLNLFDAGIAQFDIYTSLGYGQKKLDSGTSDVISGSLGAGIWINSFITARIEGRYESYTDLLKTQKRKQSAVSAIASVGVMLW